MFPVTKPSTSTEVGKIPSLYGGDKTAHDHLGARCASYNANALSKTRKEEGGSITRCAHSLVVD